MSIVVFLFVFSVIVTLHEWGHYYVAKKSGVLVREFALGMGPKVFSWRKGETTYTLRLLPLGGFVRMAGDGDDVEEIKKGQLVYLTQNDEGKVTEIDTQEQSTHALALPIEVNVCDLTHQMIISGYVGSAQNVETFEVDAKAILIEKDGTRVQVAPVQTHLESKSPLKRIAIYLAGPVNNFLLSIVVFTIMAFATGGVNSMSNRVTVAPNGAAQQVGIQTDDTITAINDTPIVQFSDIATTMDKLRESNTKEVQVTFLSQGVQKTVTVILIDGYLGVAQAQDTDLMSKLTYGLTQTVYVIKQVWLALVGLVTSGFKLGQLGGPIAIVQASGQVAQAGFLPILAFLAMLSANLGVMNLLPIPGLDGGKILLAFIELLRGKPISKEKEMMVTMIGVGLLLLLMISVTFNDISRLFNR